jgi:hypothetical protein
MTLTYGGYLFFMFLVVIAYRLGYDEGRTVRRRRNRINNNNRERGKQ